jgi:hypothetical protein
MRRGTCNVRAKSEIAFVLDVNIIPPSSKELFIVVMNIYYLYNAET